MKHVKITVSEKKAETLSAELLVFLVSGDGKKVPDCDKLIKPVVEELFDIGDFKGKNEENMILYPHHFSHLKKLTARRVALVGVGPFDKDDDAPEERLETVRKAGGLIAAAAKKVRAAEIHVVLPGFLPDLPDNGAEPLVEGILLGDYRFGKYKKDDEDEKPFPGIEHVILHTRKKQQAARKSVKRAQTVSEAVNVARNMANEPGNTWTPKQFADFARKLAKSSSLKCTVLQKAEIAKAGMGGIMAVNQGSSVDPQMVVLEYVPKQAKHTILLVGKGITFDSGGISLKPAAGMQDMKYDMCGAAAVLAAMQVVAHEQPDVRVVAVVPATDNMSGAAAVKPGDIITHYNGTTSEVVNTDAEGRLILADALAYGIERYEPDCVIDLATLTGAVIVGLGHHRTGLMSNHDGLAEHLLKSGDICGEPLWRLPLGKEYSKQLESDVADMKNVGGKGAGAITAACYLEKFVNGIPWAHLDIAGTAWDFTKKSYIPKGPSGTGVRTLVQFIRTFRSLSLRPKGTGKK